MVKGDRIKWQYIHYLNSKSYTVREKCGVFVRNVVNREFNTCFEAMVHFDGNKGLSKIPITEIRFEDPRKEYKRPKYFE